MNAREALIGVGSARQPFTTVAFTAPSHPQSLLLCWHILFKLFTDS
jgi:hypothetical protein